MSILKQYSKDYENVKRQIGYEFVEGYTDRNFIMHESYCRKIKRKRYDPIEKQQEIQWKLEQKRIEESNVPLGFGYDDEREQKLWVKSM